MATLASDPIAAHCKLLYEASRMPKVDYILDGKSVLDIKP